MDINEILEANIIMANLRDAEEQAEEERQVLQMKNPFTLSDTKFIKKFRLSKNLVRHVIALVTPHMQGPSRASALTIERKVLTALRFFGRGCDQEFTGSNSYTAVSQSSTSRAITEVCAALNQPEIFEEWVSFPRNFNELEQLRNRFFQRYRIPGVVGCIDCTHIPIIAPPRNDALHPEHVYVNRKNYHSINTQLVCDENLRILNVNARFPGNTHDAHIWRESAISRVMEDIYRHDNNNVFFLVGDAGYPLRPWLMTALRNPPPNTPEARFSNALKSIRSTVERCNGVLKNRFRCLIKHRTLHYHPTVARNIINACVVLHNMCIANNVPEPAVENVLDPNFGLDVFRDINELEPENNNRANVNPDLRAGRTLQRQLIFRNNLIC